MKKIKKILRLLKNNINWILLFVAIILGIVTVLYVYREPISREIEENKAYTKAYKEVREEADNLEMYKFYDNFYTEIERGYIKNDVQDYQELWTGDYTIEQIGKFIEDLGYMEENRWVYSQQVEINGRVIEQDAFISDLYKLGFEPLNGAKLSDTFKKNGSSLELGLRDLVKFKVNIGLYLGGKGDDSFDLLSDCVWTDLRISASDIKGKYKIGKNTEKDSYVRFNPNIYLGKTTLEDFKKQIGCEYDKKKGNSYWYLVDKYYYNIYTFDDNDILESATIRYTGEYNILAEKEYQKNLEIQAQLEKEFEEYMKSVSENSMSESSVSENSTSR